MSDKVDALLVTGLKTNGFLLFEPTTIYIVDKAIYDEDTHNEIITKLLEIDELAADLNRIVNE